MTRWQQIVWPEYQTAVERRRMQRKARDNRRDWLIAIALSALVWAGILVGLFVCN